MSFSKNSHKHKTGSDNSDDEHEFCAAVRPHLDRHCEFMMFECCLSSGNVEVAKKLTLERLRQHFRDPADYRNSGYNNPLPWIMKIVKNLVTSIPNAGPGWELSLAAKKNLLPKVLE